MSNYDADELFERLKDYVERIRQSTYQAIALNEIFQTFNDATKVRNFAIGGEVSGRALNIMIHSVLRELILILVRLLDSPGRDVLKSNRVSFPVILELVKLPGVKAKIEAEARVWLPAGDLAEENAALASEAITRMAVILERLRVESPNKAKLLRDYRNQFLAHELHFEKEREKPIFGHIPMALSEIKELTKAASMAIDGSDLELEFLSDDFQTSTSGLISLIDSNSP